MASVLQKNKDTESLTTKLRSGRPSVWSQENDQQRISDVLKPASEFETDFWTCHRLVQYIKRDFKERFRDQLCGDTCARLV